MAEVNAKLPYFAAEIFKKIVEIDAKPCLHNDGKPCFKISVYTLILFDNFFIENTVSVLFNKKKLIKIEKLKNKIEKNRINNVGEKFGRLTILDIIWDYDRSKAICKCDCGNDYVGIKSDIVILTTGTSLEGRMFIGLQAYPGGRLGEAAAYGLSDWLRKNGIQTKKLKTGTPARVDKRTIDYSKMTIQPGDDKLSFYSYKPNRPIRPQVPCYLTRTNEDTHRVIRENLDKSPMYQGLIQGVGPRYCPSIEDKIVRFASNPSHHIFIEPEGLNTYEVYIQGFSTSLPACVQVEMLRSLPGLEKAHIIKPAYAVEYDYVPAVQTLHSLMSKDIKGLFFAGQINGTSGYEEAAAQGLIAGINASMYVLQNSTILTEVLNCRSLNFANSVIGLPFSHALRNFSKVAISAKLSVFQCSCQ